MSPAPSGTGHRSLNPNVTPPGLRPGAREGEPQARRCRSRVSVPSSAVERGPGLGRLDPSGAAMHKLLVLANALVRQNRPGEDRTTGTRRRGSGREVRRPPPHELSSSTPARAMLDISSTTTGCTEPESPSPSGTGHLTPTSLPPVCDRGRGRASRRRVDAVPASAFRRRPLNGGQIGRLDPSGAAMHKLLVLANALVGQNRPGETGHRGAAAWQRAGSAPATAA